MKYLKSDISCVTSKSSISLLWFPWDQDQGRFVLDNRIPEMSKEQKSIYESQKTIANLCYIIFGIVCNLDSNSYVVILNINWNSK